MRNGALGTVYALQCTPRYRWAASGIAAVVGLGLASLHWSGLLLGAALVAWAWPTLGRAVLAGVAFAVLVLLAFLVSLRLSGTLGAGLTMGRITLLTAAIPLVLGALGGLSRGLLSDAPEDSGT